MEKLEGTIENIVFTNEANGYTVCYVSSGDETVTVTGYIPNSIVGEHITAHGEWTTHPDYGDQFKAEYAEKTMPSDESDIAKYLASGAFPGIGKATAEKIVEKFGKDTFKVIEQEPEKLKQIKGLTEKKISKIHTHYIEQIGIREIVVFLQQYEVPATYAVKVYQQFGDKAVEEVRSNPYVLSDEIDGIGFKMADKIASQLGIEKNSMIRIQAGIKYFLLQSAAGTGHTFMPRSVVIRKAAAMLGVGGEEVEDGLALSLMRNIVVMENMGDYDAIYLKRYHDAEKCVAEKLKELCMVGFEFDRQQFSDTLYDVEKESEITLAKAQKEAVNNAFETSVMVITGGPGTGKTTIINTIIKLMQRLGKEVVLAAPTGRAAKRMTEMCGDAAVEAKTIHRLLEMGYDDINSSLKFARNEDKPIEADVIIIDEMSMVDILLMEALVNAITVGTRLIMVGDIDQLPPVGAGNVLKDIIASGTVSCIMLTEIFRQAQESMIVVNAHKINSGKFPVLNEKDNDFFFVHRSNPDDLCETIADLCLSRLPKYYNIDKVSQIQVITPMRKTQIGSVSLNNILQDAINPYRVDKPQKITKFITYRLGDKVMQVKNNYNLVWTRTDAKEEGSGIFNGDVGFITEIDNDMGTVTVMFDDKLAVYNSDQLDELELAYAITVHKSQGSEFDVVVMPMFEVHNLLMTRNLLYTAVTRAKILVVLVGKQEIMQKFINNASEQMRYSGLKYRLVMQ